MKHGAVILCGGQSRRMGCDKAAMLFGDETLLARTVRIVGAVVPLERIACVAAASQTLSTVPEQVLVVRDAVPELGPLAALAAGVRALESECGAVLTVSCDTPLLSPALIRLLLEESMTAEILIAELDGRDQPFPGVYRTSVAGRAETLLAAGVRSMRALIAESNCQRLVEEQLRKVDPDLDSFLNCNDERELSRALILARNQRHV